MALEFLPTSDITEYGSFDPDVASLPAPGQLNPQQIATAYNIPNSTGVGVKIGILSLGGGFLQSDINQSLSELGLAAPFIKYQPVDQAVGWTPTTNFSTDLATYNGNASLENALDIFCVAGMTPRASITIYVGTVNSADTYAGLVQRWNNLYYAAIADGCDVITQSWSCAENLAGLGDFLSAPLAAAAAQGISVFNSTGDAGSRNKAGVLGVNYPASNANVIAVGGTDLTLNTSNTRTSEVASKPSGGGISSIIPLPTYQTRKTSQTYTRFSSIPFGPNTPLPLRGIPDISAPFGPYAFYFGGNVSSGIYGTSASTPIMAGIMARFISLNNGRRPPPNSSASILYASPGSFFDIIKGNNAYALNTGYNATPSWDAVTGLGSQANGTQTYQSVTSAGLKVKTDAGWSPVAAVNVKTNSATWSPVQKIWTKTATGWTQVF